MAPSTDVFIFGDQSISVIDSLQELLLIKNNAPLTSFLFEAFAVIQRETSALSSTERNAITQAENLGLLLDAIRKSTTHTALDSALLCIYEIAYYIEYLARTNRQHPPAPSTLFLGICTGALAAAAISCSLNVFDIARLGVQAVTVAFRNGMNIHRRSEVLGYFQSTSWSVVFPSGEEEPVSEALVKFSTDKNLPTSLQPYISAVGPNFVTITGPPNVLDQLKSFDAFSGKKLLPLPISGPYHTENAFSETHLRQLLDFTLTGIEYLDREILTPILSCASGSLVKQTSFGGLLRDALTGVLAQQIRIDRVNDGLFEILSGNESETSIIPVNTQVAANLANFLSQKGVKAQVGKTLKELAKQTSPRAASEDSNKIAIVGFSGRFPEADDLVEFWDLLTKGLDVHKPVPEERFARDHYDPTGQRKNTSQVQYGCWLKNAGLFDTQFFHMSPKEAIQTDPAQRLALLTAYEALEMAGFVPDRTPSTQRHRVGVFYGTTSNDWGEVNSSQDVDTHYIPGANRAFIPGRVNFFFKFTGPSIAVDTACSSSLAAINIAINCLINRDCDSAIAGGTNVMTNPDNFAGLDRGHFLSRTGNCKAFDDGADGYCRADGIGTLILKRLPDAIADNDPIFGIILGAHTNHSAESVSITRPLADAQEYLFKKLLNESGIHPHDVGYVEMHGTGTQAGDAVEMRSVLNSFAWDHSRPKDKSLYLGAVKSNVGHAGSASGVIAVIKVLLMMQKNKIPPHCGIKTKINHNFPTDLDRRGVNIALGGEADWPRPLGGKRRVLINNFSAAGGNTSLLLEDGPVTSDDEPLKVSDPRTNHVVIVSARSSKALEENLRALEAFVANSWAPEGELLGQLSYTTTARRIHHSRRVAIVTNGFDDLRRSLFAAATTAAEVKGIPAKTPGVGFLFTGQGAQETAMANGYYKHFTSFQADIHGLDTIARLQGLPSILPLVDGSVPIEELSPVVVQLGSCIIQIALARFWISLGIKPDYVIGHSLGEFAALQVAGVLSINDAIYLCGQRAVLIEKKCTANTHGMVAVKESADVLRPHIPGDIMVEIACINGTQDTVLSGPNAAVDAIASKFTQLGFKSHRLEVPFAFHSSQVDPILEELEELAARVEYHDPVVPLVSTLLGKVVTSADMIGPQYIRRHCREAVDFLSAIQAAEAEKLMDRTGVCIEIGAHPILTRMVKSIVGQELKCCASLRRKEDFFRTVGDSLSALFLAGLPVNWDEYHRDFASSRKVITLPKYSWQLANYWMQYKYSWCLTKGDAPVEALPPAPAVQAKAIRLSDSVHEIVERTIDSKKSSIVIQSDLHDPALLTVAQNHRVNDLIMAPSTLFADVAYTLGKHLLECQGSKWQTYMPAINNMAVEKALLVNEVGPQFFRASVEIDWKTQHGSMQIYSVNGSGKKTTLHAVCDVDVEDPQTYQENWQAHLYLIKRSIAHLTQGVDDGSVHKMHRGMLYKMFSSSVQYGPPFQGIQQVWFDSDCLEGTAKVFLPSGKGEFALNPYCCDSLGHLTGFIMNCNDSLDVAENVYINHGWRFLHLSEPYQCDVNYQTYVRMQAVGHDDSTYSGDVHVLRDGKIIAICGGVTFKKVPRRVLEMMLPNPSASKAKAKKAKVIAAPIPVNIRPPSPPTTNSSAASTPPPEPVFDRAEKPASAAPGLVQKALEIIADEIGVELAQVTDSTLLADLGVDSLMSLTVLGNFREELDLDIPAAQFYECLSVKDFKKFLVAFAGITEQAPESSAKKSLPAPASAAASGLIQKALEIIADEIGVELAQLTDSTLLADLGVDSLMSLTILGNFREELDLDIPAAQFYECLTVKDFKEFLVAFAGITEEIFESSATESLPSTSPSTAPSVHNGAIVEKISPVVRISAPVAAPIPRSTSIILQGTKHCSNTLFLFPDGAGSATSYVTLPAIFSDLRVIGLNSPYLTKPKEFQCALQDITGSYLNEVRRRQPKGPYHLAGWSAGGVSAFDAARQLVAEGEVVESLILIDSPNPVGLGKLPKRMYDFLENSGIFGAFEMGEESHAPPDWLFQHFCVFIEALDRYAPVPFEQGASPKTTIIWAKDGVCKNPDDPRPEKQVDDPRGMNWLLDNREDFGPCGWDEFIGAENISTFAMEDANHFTMMREPIASELCDMIRKAMGI